MKEITNQSSNNHVFSYIRVSSKDQERGASLDEQLDRIKTYAERNGLHIVKEYREVETAAKTGRNEFQQMIEDIRKRKVHGIIFHKVDRSSRNPSDTMKLWQLTQEGYQLYFVGEGMTTSDDLSRGMLHILWGVSSAYIENLRAEVKKGIAGRIREGKFPLPGPVGYVNAGEAIKKLHPHLAPLVKQAFELYATEEYSVDDLAVKMRKIGLIKKTGKPIDKKALHYLFRNPFYYGVFKYKGVIYPGIHPPIITKRLFDKVQQVLDHKGFKKTRTFEYTFRGIVVCKSCNRAMRTLTAKKKYPYYYCRKEDCGFKKTVGEPEIEKQFLETLKRITFSEEEGELFIKAAKKIREDIFKTGQEERAGIELELANLKTKLNTLLDLRLEGKLNEEVYNTKQSEISLRITELKERLGALDTADSKNFIQIEELGKLLKNPMAAYKKATSVALRRQLVKSMVANLVWNGELLLVQWKKPFDLVASRGDSIQTGPDGI